MPKPFDDRPSSEHSPSQHPSDPAPQAGRRTFLGLASGLAASALALTRTRDASAEPELGAIAHQGESGARGQDLKLRRDAYRVRVQAAKVNFEVPLAAHPANGDEERYPNKIGTDTRALPHDERGEVDPVAWESAAKAYRSRRQEDFDNIILGGSRKLINPIGTLAVSLTGLDVTQVGVPPAPALASRQKAAEAVELYWQALTRDVPFHEYAAHPDTWA